jgi:hypothetical protein
MGKINIQRLKERVGFERDNKDVDIYFEIIDRIYYQNQGSIETFDERTEITTWFFEDGRIISLDILDVTHIALFLMTLAGDVDEQLLPVGDLEKSYFLEENHWQLSK